MLTALVVSPELKPSSPADRMAALAIGSAENGGGRPARRAEVKEQAFMRTDRRSARLGVAAYYVRLLIIVAAVLGPTSAVCQSVDILAARIMDVADEATLDSLAGQLLDSRSDTTALYHLLRGLVSLQRHEITGEPELLASARESFKIARDIDKASAWAQYGYGLALEREPEVSATLIATGRAWSRMLGRDDMSKARRAFEGALQLDPGLTGAAIGLGELALKTRNTSELTGARSALLAALAGKKADVMAVAMLSRVALALGDSAAAVATANGLTVGNAPPYALHAVLWVLAREEGREDEVAEAYYRLVAKGDARELARLYLELQPILSEREKAAWQAGGLEQRRRLLQGLWEQRAALAATSSAERIAEHWRRLERAVEEFPRRVEGQTPMNALETTRDGTPFDDRGAIYVRHGEPTQVITTWAVNRNEINVSACSGRNFAFRGNESWIYYKADGSRVMYHFARCFDWPDFMLLRNVPCTGQWVAERTGYDMGITDCTQVTQERIRSEARAALATDSYRPRFDRNVPVVFDLLAFRGFGGRTDLLAPVAVAADSLSTHLIDNQTVYGFRLTLAVVDTAKGNSERVDTTLLARSEGPRPPHEMIRNHVQFSALPTQHGQFRLALRGSFASSEGYFYGADIRVPDFSGDSLMVSSIVLATPDSAGSWRRGNQTLTLMPLGRFERGVFRAFFEVYNLQADSPYTTEISIEPIGRGGPEPIRLRFQDFAQPEPDGVVRDMRRIESGLPPGRYRIVVRVTDASANRSAHVEQQFVVTAR